MTRPTRRPETSFLWYRKRVPGDVQALAKGQCAALTFPSEHANGRPLIVRAKLGTEIKFSLQTRDPVIARERTCLATAHLERLYEALRTGPQRLSKMQIVALAGLVYKEFTSLFERDPGEADIWRLARAAHVSALSDPDQMERWFGESTDDILQRKGLVIDADSRTALLKEVARAFIEAAERLERNADGDYRPDPTAVRFPPWEEIAPLPTPPANTKNSLTFKELFDRWQRERQPSASTITTWRAYVRAFREHLNHDDPARVTKADIVAWKDALVTDGYARKGIKDGQLAAMRALFAYAVDNDLLSANPALGVKLQHKRSAGSRMQPYTDDEVGRLLALADKETRPYRRWLPWLMALSGARVGEVAQLWGNRVTEVDGVVVMQIAPAEALNSPLAAPCKNVALPAGSSSFGRGSPIQGSSSGT